MLICPLNYVADIIRSVFNKFSLKRKSVTLCVVSARHYLKDKYSKYIGVDISSEMIRVARKFCKDLNNVSFHISNIKKLQNSIT